MPEMAFRLSRLVSVHFSLPVSPCGLLPRGSYFSRRGGRGMWPVEASFQRQEAELPGCWGLFPDVAQCPYCHIPLVSAVTGPHKLEKVEKRFTPEWEVSRSRCTSARGHVDEVRSATTSAECTLCARHGAKHTVY